MTRVSETVIMTDMETADLISTTEAADLLGLERSTVIRWIRERRIEPAMKISGLTGAYLFRRSDVEAMRPEAHPRPKKAS